MSEKLFFSCQCRYMSCEQPPALTYRLWHEEMCIYIWLETRRNNGDMDGGKSRHLLTPNTQWGNLSISLRLNRIIVLKENGKRQQVFFGQLILEISPGNATFICLCERCTGKAQQNMQNHSHFLGPLLCCLLRATELLNDSIGARLSNIRACKETTLPFLDRKSTLKEAAQSMWEWAGIGRKTGRQRRSRV